MSFQGKVAIVTGAGTPRGIGRAIVLCLAAKGADIVVADMNLQGAEAIAKEVQAMGRKALPVCVNVTDEASIQAMVEAVKKEFGRIDILVNNAGITQPAKVLDTTAADWDRIMAVNLKGTFLCSKAVVPTMAAQKIRSYCQHEFGFRKTRRRRVRRCPLFSG